MTGISTVAACAFSRLQHLVAADVRHHHVEQDEVEALALEPRQRRVGRLRPRQRCGRRAPTDGRAVRGSRRCRRRQDAAANIGTDRVRSPPRGWLEPLPRRRPCRRAVACRRRRPGVAAEIDQRVDALEHAVGRDQKLAESASSTSCSPAASSASISPYPLMALMGVRRSCRSLALIENHRTVGCFRAPAPIAAARAAHRRRCGCARDREDTHRATAAWRPRSGCRYSR